MLAVKRYMPTEIPGQIGDYRRFYLVIHIFSRQKPEVSRERAIMRLSSKIAAPLVVRL